MRKQHLTLTDSQVVDLQKLVDQRTVALQTYRRAQGLLLLHHGASYQAVAAQVAVNWNTVAAWAARYRADGLALLLDQPRSGRPLTFSGEQRAQLTALACSSAPSGRSGWSLRLLATKAVELGYFPHLSHAQAGEILKKTPSSPT